jgi:hypothetical protein
VEETLARAIYAGTSDDAAVAIAHSTSLLGGEWPLSHVHVAGASALMTSRRTRAGTTPGAFARGALIVSLKGDCLLSAEHGLHKFNFERHGYIRTLSWNWATSLLAALLELVKHVVAWSFLELVLESLKACVSLSLSRITAVAVFRLLIAIKARLVINPAFLLVAQCSVGIANVSESLFGLCCFVHIRMVLLGELKVLLLNFFLTSTSANP